MLSQVKGWRGGCLGGWGHTHTYMYIYVDMYIYKHLALLNRLGLDSLLPPSVNINYAVIDHLYN